MNPERALFQVLISEKLVLITSLINMQVIFSMSIKLNWILICK